MTVGLRSSSVDVTKPEGLFMMHTTSLWRATGSPSISIIAVVANLLILPTLPYAMGLVFMTGLFAGVPGIGVAVGFVTEKLLQYHIAVVEFFAAQKYFIIEVPVGNPWVYILYIVALALFVLSRNSGGNISKIC